jgi:hypothetical protein
MIRKTSEEIENESIGDLNEIHPIEKLQRKNQNYRGIAIQCFEGICCAMALFAIVLFLYRKFII